jgi:hypothetical protein
MIALLAASLEAVASRTMPTTTKQGRVETFQQAWADSFRDINEQNAGWWARESVRFES